MPEPLRIINSQMIECDKDRVTCLMTVSPLIAIGATVLSIAGFLVTSFVSVGRSEAALILVFALFPACGLALTALVLFTYDKQTTLHVPEQNIVVQERIFRLPLSTHTWQFRDFEKLVVWVRSSGRENKPGNYFTIVLKGPQKDLPLFDLEDYEEAKRSADELSEILGLPKT